MSEVRSTIENSAASQKTLIEQFTKQQADVLVRLEQINKNVADNKNAGFSLPSFDNFEFNWAEWGAQAKNVTYTYYHHVGKYVSRTVSQIQSSYPAWSAHVQHFLLHISAHVNEYSKEGFEIAVEKTHQFESFLQTQLIANGVQKDQAHYITLGVLSLVALILLVVVWKIFRFFLRLVLSILAFVFCCSWARKSKEKKAEKKKPEAKKETKSN